MTETLLRISLEELCQCGGVTQHVIIEAVEYGIAMPVEGDQATDWVFDATTAHWLKKAIRLHHDLELDWVAVAMVVDLLQQKELLENENKRFQLQLARFIR